MSSVNLDIKTLDNKLVITVDKNKITPEYIIELINCLQFQSKIYTPEYFQTLSHIDGQNQISSINILPQKREWKYSGSVNLNHKIDGINLRDFAYE